MSMHKPMSLASSTVVTPATPRLTTIPPSAMATAAALLAAANAYVAGATMPFGAILAWIVPGLFLVSVRIWRPTQSFLFGCAFGVVVGLGLGVAEGATVDVVLGSLLSVRRGSALLSSALPFGLMAYAYTALGQQMPSSARGSFAAWLWPGAEMLRTLMAPETSWVNLGATQHLAQLTAGMGGSGSYIVSFVMVLVSCTAVELMLDRSSLRFESRSLLRWVGLPALAVSALYVNLATAAPAAALARRASDQPIVRSQTSVTVRGERRGADRPVLTVGTMLTAI